MSSRIECKDGHELLSVELDSYAEICPLCGKAIEAIFHVAELTHTSSGRRLQAVFQCPRSSCRSFMIALYSRRQYDMGYEIIGVYPIRLEYIEFSKEIQQLSPSFVEIYNQAYAAEQHQLSDICGPGYRKALEFLIKDYACTEKPNEIDQIKKLLLAPCIKQYIDDVRVQETAERAAWLGNDETHYIRKWTQKDVGDLKILIRLTVNWIENVLITKQYISSMPKT